MRDYRRHVTDPIDLLTSREREVLQMIAEGKTNKEIATMLNLSVYTVDAHRGRIMEKLNLHSTGELVRGTVSRKKTTNESPVAGAFSTPKIASPTTTKNWYVPRFAGALGRAVPRRTTRYTTAPTQKESFSPQACMISQRASV